MAYYKIEDTLLTGIADAIRAKKETTAILTPAQMVAEIEGIVIGDNLPNAEDVSFGTASGSENGILSDLTFSCGSYSQTKWIYTNGLRFTVKESFAFSGFRYCSGDKGSSSIVLDLWDASTKEVISTITTTSSATSEWSEIRIASPINLEVGKTYVVSIYCMYYALQENLTNVSYNEKITDVTCVKSSGWGYTYPTKVSSGLLYGIDILIDPPLTESVVTEYKIQTATMNNIADEVKRITGATGTLSLAQIVTALQGIATQTTEATE